MSIQDNKRPTDHSDAVLEQILHALHKLRYGAVEIVVHDGRIVQIERREKLRIDTGIPVRPAG